MRESNYKTVASNKAAVTISASLYDRRALDVTSDKPLVNSLNHLTYLVSSLAKVRETLAVDGGVERLVEILHECHNTTFNLANSILNHEKKLLAAWKWTLTFQCLVLIGTRGTERIRQKVVQAGILPIIATVLDNYLTLNEQQFVQHGVFVNGGPPMASTSFANNTRCHPCPYTAQHLQPLQTSLFSPAASRVNSRVSEPSDPMSQPSLQGSDDLYDRPVFADDLGAAPPPHLTPAFAAENSHPPFSNENSASFNATSSAGSGVNPPGRHPREFALPFSMSQFESGSSPNINFPIPQISPFCKSHLTHEDYNSLSIEELMKLIRSNPKFYSVNNDVRRKYLIVNIIKRLREQKTSDYDWADELVRDNEIEMDSNLNFLSDMYILEYDCINTLMSSNAKIAPRSFTESGVVIPRDDDIVWCLQLLAYISKYPFLKEELQNTQLVSDMAIREKKYVVFISKQEKFKRRELLIRMRDAKRMGHPASTGSATSSANQWLSQSEAASRTTTNSTEDSLMDRFTVSASTSPQMVNDISGVDMNMILEEDRLDLCHSDKADHGAESTNPETTTSTNVSATSATAINSVATASATGGSSEELEEESEDIDDDDDDAFSADAIDVDGAPECAHSIVNSVKDSNGSSLSNLYQSIVDSESIIDDLDREMALFQMNDKIDKFIDVESNRLSSSVIEEHLIKKKHRQEYWDYDSYDHFEVDDPIDQDVFLMDYKKVNLFSMVEKFTFLSGTDMYYWSGVIMRNSCRRNDFKGGVRQCGNLQCGKWERYPREFLKCRRCKRTKYCSRDCQMKAWHCHRNWCIPSTSSSASSTTVSTMKTTQEGGSAPTSVTSVSSGGASAQSTNAPNAPNSGISLNTPRPRSASGSGTGSGPEE